MAEIWDPAFILGNSRWLTVTFEFKKIYQETMWANSICWGRSCDKIESSRMSSEVCSQGREWTVSVSLQMVSAIETLRCFKSSHSCKCTNIICQYDDRNNWAFDWRARARTCVPVLTSNQGERRSSCTEWTLVARSRKTLVKINQQGLKSRFPRSDRCGVVCVWLDTLQTSPGINLNLHFWPQKHRINRRSKATFCRQIAVCK